MQQKMHVINLIKSLNVSASLHLRLLWTYYTTSSHARNAFFKGSEDLNICVVPPSLWHFSSTLRSHFINNNDTTPAFNPTKSSTPH
jgi:hypothetical protein